jgi:hypothetical protein
MSVEIAAPFARGVSGRLLWGTEVAAVLGRWSLSRLATLDPGWVFDGQVLESNEVYLSRRGPFTLKLGWGARELVYRDCEVSVGGESVTIRGTGSPEVR